MRGVGGGGGGGGAGGGGETLPVYSNHVHSGRPNTKINKVSSKNSI